MTYIVETNRCTYQLPADSESDALRRLHTMLEEQHHGSYTLTESEFAFAVIIAVK